MKKRIITAAIALFAICGLPTMAQNNNATCDSKPGKECRKENACRKSEDCKDQHRAARMRQFKDAFDGVQLTDAQTAEIKAIKSDSITRGNFHQVRRDYVKSVKGILTPDQYVIFLENIVINNAQLPIVRPGKDMRRTHNAKQHTFNRKGYELKFDRTKGSLKGKTDETVKSTETK